MLIPICLTVLKLFLGTRNSVFKATSGQMKCAVTPAYLYRELVCFGMC